MNAPALVTAPLGWHNRTVEAERQRPAYHAKILSIVRHHAGQPEIALLLNIGEACNATTHAEKIVWIEEVRRAIAASEAHA